MFNIHPVLVGPHDFEDADFIFYLSFRVEIVEHVPLVSYFYSNYVLVPFWKLYT